MIQSSLLNALATVPVRQLVALVAVVAVLVAVRRLAGERLTASLRRRLLLGVPWGTLLTVGGVLSIYLFVQGAWWHSRPLVTPFRTWSYFSPLGMVFGAFTHATESHLTGNLLATLVYGTVVEYVWGHYPTRRGATTFGSLGTNPFVRILAVPAAMVVVGLYSAVFAAGPIVGFSGVVFALAGFALVTRPYLFLGAVLASRVLDLLYSTLQTPEQTVGGSVQYTTPWWADIAIQGHAIGLFAGVALGATVLWARNQRPIPTRVFFATLVFAVSNGLWAVYIPLGGGRYTLFRWLGTILIFALALLVAAATTLTDERLVPDFEGSWPSLAGFALLVGFGALCLASIPANTAAIDGSAVPENGIEVQDYVVTYAEDAPNAYVDSIPIPDVGAAQSSNESGVIVVSDDREVWLTAVQKEQLAFQGRASVVVGGLGWRETVDVTRTGWSVVGNDSVYRVSLSDSAGTNRTAFRSNGSMAAPTIDGYNVTLRPVADAFELVVTDGNQTVASGRVPANASTRQVGELTFERDRTRLYVTSDETRIRIAQRQ